MCFPALVWMTTYDSCTNRKMQSRYFKHRQNISSIIFIFKYIVQAYSGYVLTDIVYSITGSVQATLTTASTHSEVDWMIW